MKQQEWEGVLHARMCAVALRALGKTGMEKVTLAPCCPTWA